MAIDVGYRPRNPETTVLYQVVAEQLELGLRSSQCGAVTFIQRYGDAVNANVHFHCLATAFTHPVKMAA